MKNIFKYLLMFGIAVVGLNSCVDDLNVTPKDPNSIQYFDQDGIFTKIYSTLATTGQQGPDGNGDVEGIDEGTSAFARMIFALNEYPTDEGWWIWNGDAGLPDLRVISWTSTNAQVQGIYYRFYFDISMCNHFLENASSDGNGADQIAEVRFIRALNYFYLLDFFGSVPFADRVSEDAKPQYTRLQVYEWLENELKELESLLPKKRLSDYRIDRVAAKMLLARLYLNAEVYTGTAQWQLARDKAKEVMDSQYKLHTTSGGGIYSPYQELFMGDNHKYLGGENGEGILNIYQDGIMTQSWGGARYFCSAFRDGGFNYFGITDTWSCFRTSPEFIGRWIDDPSVMFVRNKANTKDSVIAQYRGDEFTLPSVFKDDRAILYNDNDDYEFVGPKDNGQFYRCWSVLKWTGRYSTMPLNPTDEEKRVHAGHSPEWPDTDIPWMRVAEAYMTYAEACHRLEDDATAKSTIKVLRDRAHNTADFEISDRFLLDEWSREFYCEGRRRMDLIRFGYFAGPQADEHKYHWEGRGDVASDGEFVSIDAKYNIFPLPEKDVVAQNLKQAEGY